MESPATVGINANLTKPDAAARTRATVAAFRRRKVPLLLESATAKAIGEPGGMPLPELAEKSSVIVVLGGDGTILHTVRHLCGTIKPLAALNTGRLGFLTTATEAESETFVEAIARGRYELSQRSVLEATFTTKDGATQTRFALNEATIARKNLSRMIHLEVSIDGQGVNRFSGDGLIVATPTGSTAYSLSAGGPMVHPDSSVFVVTPVCPHALANRSFVVNDSVVVEIRPEAPQREEVVVALDGGETIALKKESPLRLKKASHTVPLVMLPGTSFYAILQQKLRWMGSST